MFKAAVKNKMEYFLYLSVTLHILVFRYCVC